MIVGAGIDIVDSQRIAAIYDRFGMRFVKHFLCRAEIAILPPKAVSFLSGRFAAKEACVKALGTGFAYGVTPGQIEILPDQLGKPTIKLRDAALARSLDLGAARFHLSISHERHLAVALVILEA